MGRTDDRPVHLEQEQLASHLHLPSAKSFGLEEGHVLESMGSIGH